MRPRSIILGAVVALAGMATAVQAQTTAAFPFTIVASTPTSSQLLANGAQVQFSAAVGQTQTVHIVAQYIGNGQVMITQNPELFGSTAFSEPVLTYVQQPLQKLPFTLNPGDSISFDETYTPLSAQQVSAQVVVPYQETAPSTNGIPVTSLGSINLNLVGTAPSFTFSYTLQSNGNANQIQPGGTITFPPTLVNTTALAAFTITNTGSGSGQITSITLTGGSAFQLQNVPLLPGTLATAQSVSVGIVYTPSGKGTDTGQIQVTYGTGTGTTVTFNLQGSSSASTYSYSVIQSGSATSVAPNGTIMLPNTNVGSTSSVIVQVMNAGSASGTVTSISITGAGFGLQTPPVLPQPIAPNGSLSFTVTFMPTQPGPATGELVVGSDIFTLSGQGIGPQLGFSYISSAGTLQVSTTNPSIVFSPIQVTQSEQIMVVVTNTGTSQATVSNISVGESPSPFSIAAPAPALPATIPAGGTIQFNVNFTPTTVAFVQGTLHVDSNVIQLSGTGTTPPPLPAYSFQGTSGTVAPQSQPGIGLTLSAPYPVDVAGTLTLTTAGNLPSDPAVQFSTGSSAGNRTVQFVIPANTTTANFAGQGSHIFLQTGTVAQTITLTPSFQTAAGGVNLTPSTPATMQLVVAPAAPALIAVEIANTSANGLTLNIIGYSTTRTLTSLNVTFSPASGFTLPTTQFTIPLSQISAAWFQSSTAQSFGGQFQITIPFALQGTVSTGETQLQAISSVSATVSNELGTSNSVQATLP